MTTPIPGRRKISHQLKTIANTLSTSESVTAEHVSQLSGILSAVADHHEHTNRQLAGLATRIEALENENGRLTHTNKTATSQLKALAARTEALENEKGQLVRTNGEVTRALQGIVGESVKGLGGHLQRLMGHVKDPTEKQLVVASLAASTRGDDMGVNALANNCRPATKKIAKMATSLLSEQPAVIQEGVISQLAKSAVAQPGP